jgi:hypothetical protein
MIDAAMIRAQCESREVEICLRRLHVSDVRYSVATTWSFLRKAGARMTGRQYETDKPMDARTASPSLSERAGRHVMRETAVKWCRAHPVEAAELPSWDLDLLRRVLEGIA